MGRAIVYCAGCNTQLRESDFEKGSAFRSDGRVYCRKCVPADVRAAPQPFPPVPQRTGKGTTRIMKVVPHAAAPGEASGPPIWIFVAAGVGALALLLLALSGSGETPARPSVERTSLPPEPPAPPKAPPTPAPNERDRFAEEALRKAREFAVAHPEDLAGQFGLFDAAVRASEETGHFQAAVRERDAVQGRRRSQVSAQLAQLDAAVRAACGREEFGAALKLVDDARPRTPSPELTSELNQRSRGISESAEKLFEPIRKQALDARRRGAEGEAAQIARRVDRWAIESFRAALAQALAEAVPKPPEPSPAPAREIDRYRREWADALGAAAARDYAGAFKKLEATRTGLGDPAAREEAAADQELLRLAQSAEDAALSTLATTPKGKKATIVYLSEGGAPVEAAGTVVRADGQEIVLSRDGGSVVIPLGDVVPKSLAPIALSRREGRGAALFSVLAGDVETAKGLADAAGPIPEKYWTWADTQSKERRSSDVAARRLFHAAEGDAAVYAKCGAAAEKCATLLKEHGETLFVRRNRSLIAARAQGLREFFFVFQDLRAGGTFRAFRGEKDELYWKTVTEGGAENFVELVFSAASEAELRCWLYVGGCCAEAMAFSAVLIEGSEPPKDLGTIKSTVSMSARTHAAHEGKGRPTPKWGWVPIALPKLGGAGVKRLRVLTSQQGFFVAQAVVSGSRSSAPTAAEARELERLRTEARGGAGKGDPGLVGHWTFAEGSGGTAADSSQIGGGAMLMNGAAWMAGSATPWNPPSVKLQGTAYLRLPSQLSMLQGVSSCTLAAWVRPDKLPIDIESNILALSKNAGNVPTKDSRATITVGNGGVVTGSGRSADSDKLQSVATVERVLGPGAWSHVAAAFDYAAGSITIYVNGTARPVTGSPVFSAKSTPDTPSTSGAIGAEEDGSGRFFQGRIADVRVYNRALTRKEISELAQPSQAQR